jgi:hypothetical protein
VAFKSSVARCSKKLARDQFVEMFRQHDNLPLILVDASEPVLSNHAVERHNITAVWPESRRANPLCAPSSTCRVCRETGEGHGQHLA